MRILKTKWLNKWAKKNHLTDNNLFKTVGELANRNSSTKLGKYLYKVRVPQQGKGKSGSYRTIVIYKTNIISIFIYGFSKNEKENLTKMELKDFKKFAKSYIKMNKDEITLLINLKSLFELEVNSDK